MQQFDRTPSRLDFSNTASSFVFLHIRSCLPYSLPVSADTRCPTHTTALAIKLNFVPFFTMRPMLLSAAAT